MAARAGGFLEAARAQFDGSNRAACLVLLLDRRFLPGLCTLVASLMRTRTLVGLPIVVMTSDPAVAGGAVARALAHRIRFSGPADLERFRAVSSVHVTPSERHPEIAKYTLLKFHFFEDHGLGDQIFLDCDTVVRRPLDDLCLRQTGYDFLAAPALVHSRRTGDRIRSSLAAGIVPGTRQINSGFMILRAGALAGRPGAVDALVARAAAARFSKEQVIVSDFMRGAPRTAALPVSWNFLRSYAERIGEAAFREIEAELGVLHYVMLKPWQRRPRELGFFDRAWLEVVAWAAARFDDWPAVFAAALALAATAPEPPQLPVASGRDPGESFASERESWRG